MLTKKHFNAIAKILNKEWRNTPKEQREDSNSCINRLIVDFAFLCFNDNPNFKRILFLDACCESDDA